ncbi:hypothetical protein A9Q96_02590 [Rhodobacterales bacterium 52_120_T64]|nr:hypothetical protein A9Q96_02590 [Rhodobacterales bacterium 52_120_T64]
MTAPAGDISNKEKQELNAALFASGAPIGQMNIARQHLSRVKGGQLAAVSYPARMLSLLISDVPGGDPAGIPSGPTVGGSSTHKQARLALSIGAALKSGDDPVLLLSGGECTLTRRADGCGGPNAEFLLAAAISLGGAEGIYAIACDADGVDAGEYLKGNDSHEFFAAVEDQGITGPTFTNVNDFRASLITPNKGI